MRRKIYNFLKTSEFEIKELLKAWLVISLAFGIVLSSKLFSIETVLSVIIAGLSVGVGFIGHELAHKYIAQRYGLFAEFRAFNSMLIVALVLSLMGFVFAAPGAVIIRGQTSPKRYGKISAAGPMSSLIIAIIFLGLFYLVQIPFLSLIFRYGFVINSWLALFNLIPIGNFDGRKILMWDKFVYGILVFIAFVLMFLQGAV